MKSDLPKRLFDLHLFVTRPIFNIKRSHSRLSQFLVLGAVLIATTLTVLLIKETSS